MFKLFASPSALLLLACSGATATGNIAVIGGANGQGPMNSIEIIAQADTKAVEQKQTLKAVRSSVAAASLDGTVYAIGGLNSSDAAVKTCEELDTTNSVWSDCPDLLVPLYGHAAVAHAGKVYAIGGFLQEAKEGKGDNVNRKKSLMILDTTTDDTRSMGWVYGAWLIVPRSWAAAVAVEGKLYVIGGIGGVGKGTDSVEVLNTSPARYSAGSEAGVTGWELLKNGNTQVPLNAPRFGHAAATYNGKIYVTGGVRCASYEYRCAFPGDRNTGNTFAAKSLEILDTASAQMSWTYGPELQIQRQLHASAFIGGMLIVMGGSIQESGFAHVASVGAVASSDTDSVEMLDIANINNGAVWVDGKPLRKKRQGIAAVAFTVTVDATEESVTVSVTVDATEESVTADAMALEGKIAGIDVVDNSVTVEAVDDNLIIEITLRGELADFNAIKEDFKMELAERLSVSEADITLSVAAGSIVVTATVHNPDAGAPIVDANSQVSDASHANLALVFVMVVMTSLQLVCY